MVVAAVAVGLLVVWPTQHDGDASEAPTFSTFDLTGRPVSLRDFRGSPVLVNFWASWCIPCRREFPLLREVQGHDVYVLGVVFDDSPSAARRFMREEGATWPGLVDPEGRIAAAYDVGRKPGIPVTVAIDADGRLVDRQIGEARRADLVRLVQRARSGPLTPSGR